MKNLIGKVFIICLMLAPVLLVSCKAKELTQAEQEKYNQLAEQVSSRDLVFVARFANPMNMRTVSLTGNYTLRISEDKIEADLPYFGRAYSAPINPSDGGIRFTSMDFDYLAVPKKGNALEITIKPKDVKDSPVLYLHINATGNSTLSFQDNIRQSISFSGDIE